MNASRRARLVWFALLASTSGILLLAVLPPFLPAEWQFVVRRCFASVCHQMPTRSPHLYGVPLAICDRCTGIYVGFVLGVGGTGWGTKGWSRLGSWGRYLLLGSLIPLGIDWVAPIIGLWNNGPISRALTGFLFGGIAASFVTDRLLRRIGRENSSEQLKTS